MDKDTAVAGCFVVVVLVFGTLFWIDRHPSVGKTINIGCMVLIFAAIALAAFVAWILSQDSK